MSKDTGVTDEKLIRFAKQTLLRMTTDEEWNAATTDHISNVAVGLNLAETDDRGMFVAGTREAQAWAENKRLVEFRDAYARALEQPRTDHVVPNLVVDYPGKKHWKIGVWNDGIDVIVIIDTQRVVPRMVTPAALELSTQ
jgi:hypothetical protein